MSNGWETINCAICGKETIKRGSYQKYCAPCSAQRAAERKNDYYIKTRKEDGYKARQAEKAKEGRIELRDTFLPEAGKFRSESRSISAPFYRPELEWVCRIVIPFTGAASKNAIYGITGWHVFKREAGKAFQLLVERKASEALRQLGITPVQNKVWMSIHVEKPNNRFDAINVVDAIADGLKKAIGIDDRWFSIGALDWSICKDEPRFIIEFGQDSLSHVQACSCCGQLQDLAEYGKSTGRPMGVHRICKSCVATAREIRRNRRKAKEAA